MTTTETTSQSAEAPGGADQTTPKSIGRSGIQTSEFWISLMTMATGLGLIVYGAVAGKDTAMTIGAVLAGLPGAAYPISRGLAKSAS